MPFGQGRRRDQMLAFNGGRRFEHIGLACLKVEAPIKSCA